MGRISEQLVHNRAFCEESTIFTGCVDFYTSMKIRYKAICEINPESQKNRINFLTFQYKFILLIKILKFQGSSQKQCVL